MRIKIWDRDHSDAVVYNNQVGTDDSSRLTTPGTELQIGSIVIHRQ